MSRYVNQLLLGLLLPALLASGGCIFGAKPAPKPFTAPPVKAEVTHFSGTALSGPTTRPIQAVPLNQSLSVHVTFFALEKPPVAGTPLASAARLIAAERLGTPMLPSARLTRSARVVELKDPAELQSAVIATSAGQAVKFLNQDAAVAAGVTAVFSASDPPSAEPRAAGPHRLELYVTRPDTSAAAGPGVPIELALVAEALAPLPQSTDKMGEAPKDPKAKDKPAAPAPPPPAPVFIIQREVALLPRTVTGRDVVCLTLPFEFSGTEGKYVAILVEVETNDSSAEHQAAMSRAVEDGKKSATLAAAAPGMVSAGRAEGTMLAVGLAALTSPGTLRASTVYLASQSGAHLLEDAALVADDATLALLARQLQSDLGPAATQPATLDPTVVGWKLDKSTFDFLGKLLSDATIPAELQSVLVRHFGEAGRRPSSIEEVGRSATGRDDFLTRITAENMIYLEDSSPSARLRSYDWLQARSLAPARYDPLGPLKERRAALEKAGSAAPADPATPGK